MTAPAAPWWAWLSALRDPAVVDRWTLDDWQRVIRLSRRTRLLGRLGEALVADGRLAAVPEPAARHLRAELRFARWQTQALCWAAERAGTCLADAPYPKVLLKGAAYIAQGLAIGRGRLPSDLDLLVPKTALADAQRRLAAQGWREMALDEHDRRYYREWTHEVPPMRHPAHSLELDLHHNILPPVARLRVDAVKLLARVQPSPWAGWQVLDPLDQILHSAAHLFQDSDLSDRVRDLVDLDALLREGLKASGFWPALTERARELGLGAPLALACHFTQAWLDTPVPPAVHAALRPSGPGPVQRLWLLPALSLALTPVEPDGRATLQQRLAARLVLLRYHLTRMPLTLLLPHAWHKLRQRPGAAAGDPFGVAGARPMRRDDAA
jgi:hypothetical protein